VPSVEIMRKKRQTAISHRRPKETERSLPVRRFVVPLPSRRSARCDARFALPCHGLRFLLPSRSFRPILRGAERRRILHGRDHARGRKSGPQRTAQYLVQAPRRGMDLHQSNAPSSFVWFSDSHPVVCLVVWRHQQHNRTNKLTTYDRGVQERRQRRAKTKIARRSLAANLISLSVSLAAVLLSLLLLLSGACWGRALPCMNARMHNNILHPSTRRINIPLARKRGYMPPSFSVSSCVSWSGQDCCCATHPIYMQGITHCQWILLPRANIFTEMYIPICMCPIGCLRCLCAPAAIAAVGCCWCCCCSFLSPPCLCHDKQGAVDAIAGVGGGRHGERILQLSELYY
jgi:hypothetical protein